MQRPVSRAMPRLAFVLAAGFSLSCGGGGGGDGGGGTQPPPTPTITVNGGNNQQAAVGTAVATPPSVKVSTSNGAGVPNISVTFAVGSGGGSATATTQTTNSAGVATVGSWTMGTALGANTLTATASGTAGGPITFTATAIAGPAKTIALDAGNAQTANVGAAVATPPSVKVTDAGGNPVAGTSVTFAVASGGGSITGATQTTNASGIAAVGSWTLGPAAGANSLTATSAGLTGSPVTFTATGNVPSAITLTSVSPALLTPGISATITGSGFSTTPASNIVTIDNVSATVTAATATQLTITVPAAMPCEPTHDATISVTQNGTTPATTTKALQVATQRTLAVGQSLIVTSAGEQRCNELSNTGTSRYYVAVSNVNSTYSTTGASFQLRGAVGSGGSGLTPAGRTAAVPQLSNDAARRRPMTQLMTREDIADQAHMRLLDQNIRFLNENRGRFGGRQPGATRSIAVPVVGDQVSLNIPNITNTTGICVNPYPMTGRITYVGTRSIIVEDNANPMAGTIDTTYALIGQEFDNTMFSILQNNFGDPLAKDATTDNNQRIVMVFSSKVNVNFNNKFAGFVVSCDFVARNTTTNTTSNFGEYFYATAPQIPGTTATPNGANQEQSPPRWRWTMRGTIIHEVKHIVSFAERISRNAPVFEASWLEETTARISEELYERSVYSFTQKSNILYGNTTNTGPYCGVRVNGWPACAGRPRGIVRVFEELAPKWYAQPENYSPIGRIDDNDFSFYATGWSLVRWALDQSPNAEATFLRALTQETSLNGVASLEARTGRPFAEMVPEWTMANVLDDYPGWVPATSTPASSRMKQPSWNFRDVFSGYKADFTNQIAWSAWPLNPYGRTFGAFTVDAAVRPGTSAVIELSGTAAAKQLLELKAQTGTAAAPAELRITIVRVQ